MNNESIGTNTFYKVYGYISAGLKFAPNDNTSVRTSMGIDVPLTHCKLLYKIFKRCEKNNTSYIANGKTIPIGNYKVTSITKDRLNLKEQYVLKAGCHRISADVIDKFVEINKLDWWWQKLRVWKLLDYINLTLDKDYNILIQRLWIQL